MPIKLDRFAALCALFLLLPCGPAKATCVKRDLRKDAYAFKLRVSSTTGYFKVNVGTGPTHGECPDYRVDFIGRRTLAGDPSGWKSVREEACFVIGEGGTAQELGMEWDVVVPFVPDSGLAVKVYPSGAAGNVQVTLLDFSGKQYLSQSFSRNDGVLMASKAQLPPPGGLASVLPAKPVLAPYMGAYLFPWYGLPTGPTKALVHWDAGPFIFHPSMGQYDSGDPETIRKQMAWMKAAGFNLTVVSYWDQEGSNKNLAPIMDGATAAGLAVSAMIETSVRRTGVSPRDCFLAQIQEIRQNYAGQAAWLKAEGKPILFVYDRVVGELKAASGDKWWDDWLWVRQQAGDFILMAPITDSTTPDQIKATGGGSVFAANSGAGDPWVGSAAVDWQWAWTAYQGGGLSALPILPRFMRAAEPGDVPNYRNQWRAARDAMPDIILVNSWNEYHESSVIEPTVEFGEDWLRLSAHETDLFCRGELGPLVPATDTAIPSATAPRAPVHRAEGNIQVTYAGGNVRLAIPDPFIREARIHDCRGRKVRTLEVRDGNAVWDGKDGRGLPAPPGLYWLSAGPYRVAILSK